MKNLFLLILFVVSYRATASPDSANVSNTNSRFSIGIIVSPDYCYRQLFYKDNATKIDSEVLKFREGYEVPKWGFTMGVSLMYEISKKFSVEGGINYSNKGYKFDISGLNFGDPIDPRFGFVYPTGEVPKNVTYNFSYFDIPVRLNYYSSGKKIQFTAQTGLIINVLLDAYEKLGSTKIELKNNYSNTGISGLIGAGAKVNFNTMFSLSLLPSFQYSLTSLQKSASEHLFSAGLTMGVFYRF